jgi:hypothetical protein
MGGGGGMAKQEYIYIYPVHEGQEWVWNLTVVMAKLSTSNCVLQCANDYDLITHIFLSWPYSY